MRPYDDAFASAAAGLGFETLTEQLQRGRFLRRELAFVRGDGSVVRGA